MNIHPNEILAAARVSDVSLCASCNSRMHCLPALQAHGAVQHVLHRFKVKRGTHLYRPGDAAGNRLYAVYSGTFKVYVHDHAGRPTIVRFPCRGNLIGLESIGMRRHVYGAIALEDSYVCEVPCQDDPGACPQLNLAISREIAKEQQIGARLRHSSADRRMAGFLLVNGERLAKLGYSATRFRLAMAKNDVANYLGLTPECISRTLVRLQQAGVLALSGREVTLLDVSALRRLANMDDPAPAGHACPAARPSVPALLGTPAASH